MILQIVIALLSLAWSSVSATYSPGTQDWCGDVANPTVTHVLNVTTGYGAPDGFARTVLMVNGQSPGPLIKADQGQTMIVTVVNKLPVQIGMHWHGLHQRGTPQFDGVPGLNQYAIPPGANMTYCFSTLDNYGAYWYHVHLRDIYQDGIRGPILIQPNSSVDTPYHLISSSTADISAMHEAALASSTLMINDWFHATSEDITARYDATGNSMRPLCANSVLFNGMGQVRCPPSASDRDSFGCAPMMSSSMDAASMSTGAVMGASSTMSMTASMSEMTSSAMGGGNMSTGAVMSSISSASMAASMASMPMKRQTGTVSTASKHRMMSDTSSTMPEPTCINTTTTLFTLDFPANATWHIFHLINAGASQHLAFSIDEHDMWVVSADGAFIEPTKVQLIEISIGQRYGVVIRRPQSPKAAYTIRASTRAEQTYQGVALLRYTSDASIPPKFCSRRILLTVAQGKNATEEVGTVPYINLDGTPRLPSVAVLDERQLAPFPNKEMPVSNRFIYLDVKQSQPTEWVLQSGVHFSANNGQQTPLLFAPRNQSGLVSLNQGDIVDVLLQIAADSMDPMAHPIHLHGHSFRLLGSSANSTFPVNTTIQQQIEMQMKGDMAAGSVKLNNNSTAPYRDTAELPMSGWLALRFVADNPGVWLLHCHINAHLTAGMAIAFMELSDQFPRFSAAVLTPPAIAPYAPIP